MQFCLEEHSTQCIIKIHFIISKFDCLPLSCRSDVASSERLKPKVKAANVTARGQERSQSW